MVIPRISEDMSSEPPSARWLVRELISRARARSVTPDDLPRVAKEACENTYRDLARELGTASAQSLVSRAQAEATAAHPELRGFRFYREFDSDAEVNSITPKHDDAVPAEAFEAMLEHLLAVLGRFVGIRIVVRLVNVREAPPAGSEGRSQ